MFSDDIAIRVEGVSMRFELYDHPRDQLKQFILPRLRRIAALPERQYFREFWALRDVSLEVRKGESCGIIGLNGSGKSTLLQIIAGTLTPTLGQVSTEGRIAALLELGSGFNPEFTGRENVYMNGALLGFSKDQIDQRFDSIAAFADIGEHLEQPVKSYSSGMVVRLAFAVQTQVEPDILIVDEALAVGDALFQKRCFRQIEKLLNNGCALLFVSHDQEIVRNLTTKSIFLNQGSVKKYGNSSEVLFSYRELLQEQEEAAFSALQASTKLSAPTTKVSNSFGPCDVEVISVTVLDGDGNAQNTLYAGDEMSIVIECQSNCDIENLNIAFRVRTKEGVKVTTWGTLNEDMPLFLDQPEKTFWSRKFRTGQRFTVSFSGICSLAANFYEIQAVAALEYEQYYGNQRLLHWIDEAAHFTVILRNRQYVFDGICDMGLRFRGEMTSEGHVRQEAEDKLTDGEVL